MKKGSIQLSMNMMIVIILSIVVISMGFFIFFKLFDQIENTERQIDAQSKRQLDILLKDSSVALSESNLIVKKGDLKVIWLGIDNDGDDVMNCNVRLEFKSSDPDNPLASGSFTNPEFYKLLSEISIPAQDTGYTLIELSPEGETPNVLYSTNVVALCDGVETTRKLFINVK